jgi:hypothetical protein
VVQLFRRPVVSDDLAILHYEEHLLDLPDVLPRVTRERNNVGKFAGR